MLRGSLPVLASALLGLGAGRPAAPAPAPAVERSVVRIVNNLQHPSWYTPWSGGPVSQMTGSGFVIAGGLIVTSAHVVSDSRFLVVYLNGDPNPHEARVVVQGHDCDLSLVKPVEASLLEKVPALPFGTMPPLRSMVETYGYPAGSDQISSTQGIVSRIDRQTYTHTAADGHLAVQTDAAINPGNSGGPVVREGRVVGVAFQNDSKLQSVGFFVPVEVIQHFLVDVKDGAYDGFPDLGVRVASLENPAARRFAGMKTEDSGVRVDWIALGGSADGHLEVGDILMGIDGQSIANDGSVASGEVRVPLGLLVDRHQVGETLALTVLHGGKRVPVSLVLGRFPNLARWSNLYDRRPRYYVYAGLVFVALDREMLKTYGDNWVTDADSEELYEFLYRQWGDPAFQRRERVVLLRRLDDAVNAAISFYRNVLVDRVNGRPVDSLEDLVRAIEENKGPYHVLEFAYFGRMAVLDREAADKANPDILRRYGVTRDRNL
jgi:S1-C subfamily serine protease